MSGRKRELTPDERQLWRRVAAGLKRRRLALEPSDTELLPPTASIVRKPLPEVPATKPAARAPATAKPTERGSEKRVRRGRLEIGATLDLHGHTQASGQAALEDFLSAARGRGDTTVIVVTGVGRGGEGVLRRRLPDWLASPLVLPMISGFAQAHRRHGGAGAFYVFIKRPRA